MGSYRIRYREKGTSTWTYADADGTKTGQQNYGGNKTSATIPDHESFTMKPSTTYEVELRAGKWNGGYSGWGDWSDTAEATTNAAPAQVTNVSVLPSGTSNTALAVTWLSVAGATSYKIQWKSGTEDWDETSRQTTSTIIAKVLSGLTSTTVYTVRVTAVNAAGDGPWSAEATGNTGPATLTVSGINATTATLTLSDWIGPWAYHYTKDSANYSACTQVASGTYTADLTGLDDGTGYNFIAYRTVNCTNPNNAGEIARKSFTTLVAPALSASAVEATTATLTIANHANDWYYQADTAPYASCSSNAVSGTTKNLTGLTPATSYTFKAYSDSACATEIAAASAFLTKPGQVTGVTIAEQLEQLRVSWTAVTGAASYKIQWKSGTQNYDSSRQRTVTALVSSITQLTKGTAYTIRVAAVNATGDGAWSAEVTGTPGSATLTASRIGATSATLTLSGRAGAWSYIYGSSQAHIPCQAADSGTYSVNLTGLETGTEYTFTAFDGSVCGSISSEIARVTFTPLVETRKSVTLTTSAVKAVKATTATVTISGHTGHWSYQVSPRPPGTLSCTKVLDGRTAVTLTGLTPGTTYTSTVYSDRDCTQKIASQTFTTLNEPLTFPRSRTIDAQSYVQHASVALTLPAATGGNPPLTYALAPALPAGLTFDRTTRTLAGTPTAPQGVTRYTYTVTDQDGKQATLTFTITVLAAVEKAIIEDGLAAQGRALLSSATGVIGARFRNPGASSSDEVGACAGENEDRGATDAPPDPDGEPDCLTGVLGTVAQAVLAMSGNGGGPADADSLGLADTDDTRPRGPRGANTASQPARNWEHLVWGRSFTLPLQAASATESAWTLWGAGDVQGFQGAPRQSKYDGQVRSLYLGVDARWPEQWLAGAALSQSWGTMDYVTGAGKSEGRLKTTLMSVYPYVRGILGTGLEVWALGGYGWGEAENTLQDAAGTRETSDLTMAMGATGARQPMTEWGGVQLAVVGGLGYLTLGTEAGTSLIADLDVAVNRARLAVEAAGAYGGLEPYVQVGGRYDGGAGQTGAGLETVAGVRYTSDRLDLEVRGRWLAAHAAEGYEEYGGLARLAVRPRADGTGWQMDVAPRWGVAQGAGLLGGGEALLDGGAVPRAGLGGMPAAGTARVLSVESQVGYGFGVFDGYGVLTPYGGFALTGEATRQYRVGTRLGVAQWLNLSLEGIRREAGGPQPANQGVQLQLEGRF